MIIKDDDISKHRDISDHAYSSKESEEEKIGRESEIEEGYGDCGDEEGADVEEEEKQLQE